MFQRLSRAGHAISAAKLHSDVWNHLDRRIELRLEDEEIVAGEVTERLRRQWATAIAHADVTTERHIGAQGSGPEPDEAAPTETNDTAGGHQPTGASPAATPCFLAISL